MSEENKENLGDELKDKAKEMKEEAKEAAKPDAKAALLERLGITADEAALLLS